MAKKVSIFHVFYLIWGLLRTSTKWRINNDPGINHTLVLSNGVHIFRAHCGSMESMAIDTWLEESTGVKGLAYVA